MSGHSLYSPSAAHRWIECPGSFAYPANTADEESSSVYADDGTASHYWGAECLKHGFDTEEMLGHMQSINNVEYEMDEERAEFVQVYVDQVRALALGRIMFVEHWIDLSEYLGEGQGGTCDAGILAPDLIIAADLKYGMGEKVWASYIGQNGVRLPNHQLGLYALGLLVDARLLGFEPKKAMLVVSQPRLGHYDEQEFSIEDLDFLGTRACVAARLAGKALVGTPAQALEKGYMNPGTKTCRWCRAQAICPKLASYVAEQVKTDFDVIEAVPPEPPSQNDAVELSRHARAVGLVEQWCKAVRKAVKEAVDAGQEIIGPDNQPMKFVEGEQGDRKWNDPAAAEALLVGQLGDKAYAPAKILTAPQAGKLLDKKKTKNMWTEHFLPLISRAPGRAVLALGSDTRPKYSGKADATEFEDVT